jgi:hypothetical protein
MGLSSRGVANLAAERPQFAASVAALAGGRVRPPRLPSGLQRQSIPLIRGYASPIGCMAPLVTSVMTT